MGGVVVTATVVDIVRRGEEDAGVLAGHHTIREGVVATVVIIPELDAIALVANAELNPSGFRGKS